MTTEKPPNPVIEMWKSMLRQGVPVEHIRQQAQRNLDGVKALPDSLPDKNEAIQDTKTFIDEIDAGKYNQA